MPNGIGGGEDFRRACQADLDNVDKSRLHEEDARALAAMRDGLVVNALEDRRARPAIDARAELCRPRPRRDEADPSRWSSRCMPVSTQIGDHIAFEGGSMVRTTALQWLQEIDDPGKRKQLFLAFSPLWDAVNGQDDAASPYRRMIALAAAAGAAQRQLRVRRCRRLLGT